MLKTPFKYWSLSISSYSCAFEIRQGMPPESCSRVTYVVDRAEIHSIFHGIPLELSVVMYHNLTVCVIEGNGLRIPGADLATRPSSSVTGESIPFVHMCDSSSDSTTRKYGCTRYWFEGKDGGRGRKLLRGKKVVGGGLIS